MKHMFKKRSNRQFVDASLVVKLLHSMAKTIKRSGYTMQELLPGLDQFLRSGLAKETLSAANERKRQFFIERLEVIKYPPSLPPRPEGLPKIDSFSSQPNLSTKNDDFSTKKSHKRREEKKNAEEMKQKGRPPPPAQPPVDEIEETEYDSVDIESIPRHPDKSQDDDIYEGEFDPVYEDPGNGEDKGEWEPDDDSGTDYENELETAENSSTYVNVDLPKVRSQSERSVPSELESTDQDDVIYENTECLSPGSSSDDPFSRSKSQKSSDALAMSSIVNATHTGELHVKQRFGNSKRVCFIVDNRLICYKRDQEKKPALLLDLSGYDVIIVDGESSSFRISHPGCATHIFKADTADSAAAWVKHLLESASVARESLASPPPLPSAPPPNQADVTTSSANSEEGSGDGVIGEVQSTEKKKRGKGLGDSLTNLLGTFGKKKGKNLKLAAANLVLDKDVAIGGYMNVSSELLSTKKWVMRWCVVKDGRFDCCVDPGDDKVEFSLALDGVVVELASKETNKGLAFKLVRNNTTKLLMEASDAMEHGKWMKVLIEQTNMASQSLEATQDEEFDEIYDNVAEDNEYVFADYEEAEYDVLTDGKSEKEEMKTSEEVLPQVTPEKEYTEEDKSHDAVVKSHSGSTIDEDKGLLESAQNPILKELRKGRRESTNKNELEDKGDSLRQQCRELRKKRLVARKKIIYEEDASEKKKLEAEVMSLEAQIEETQLELTKVQVLLQEHKTISAANTRLSPRLNIEKSNRNSSSPNWEAKGRRRSDVQERARSDAIAASKLTRTSLGGSRDAQLASQKTRQTIANLENKISPLTQKKEGGHVIRKSTGYEHKEKSHVMTGKGETKKKLVQETLKLFESMSESTA
ncbi:hypothetical protein CAPTEDRAFT_223805 [Capitella teleta]|uniref:PH domain-containing protein n=1 Tax=Capitella teleta TaxID=283909 RepID=R7UV39_CAPTE|nr:hypothetical protein CAPTEDRAFT_223805 [Capitella teleta]|eukprot:ELU10503.1 hypothetical protein CAPTEDRAFT_223805 [Capitella teleta]